MHDGEGGAPSPLLLLRRHSKLNVGLLEAERTQKTVVINAIIHHKSTDIYRQLQLLQ